MVANRGLVLADQPALFGFFLIADPGAFPPHVYLVALGDFCSLVFVAWPTRLCGLTDRSQNPHSAPNALQNPSHMPENQRRCPLHSNQLNCRFPVCGPDVQARWLLQGGQAHKLASASL